MNAAATTIYDDLGIKPIINAEGSRTVLGGSMVSDGVQAAMEAANTSFAPMADVLDKTGTVIAELLDADDAFVTSGCFAALVLSAAAVMTVDDHGKISQLPDTSGLRNEFLIQKKMRYHYDKCVSVAGGKLIEVGDAHQTTAAQMEAAIGPQTAGILYLARGEDTSGTLSIPEMIDIANKANIALILDAAAEIYPLARLKDLPSSGAALVAYGAKYLGAPQSTGILCGQQRYMDAAKFNSFISYEMLDSPAYENNIGRGYKVDRQEAVAAMVALQEWMTLDHEDRLQIQARRIETISQALADVPHVTTKNLWGEEKEPWMRLKISLDTAALGKTTADIDMELRAGTPSIGVRPESDSDIALTVHTLKHGEAAIVGEKLREALLAS